MYLYIYRPKQGRIYVGAGGHVPPPDSLVAPLQIQKVADRSDVTFEVPKCYKMQIFRTPLTAFPQTTF